MARQVICRPSALLQVTSIRSLRLQTSLEAWREDYPDAGYADNEWQREDSIYLSYAILFLPQPQ